MFFALLVTRWTGRVSAGIAAGVVSIVAPFHQSYLRVLIHFTIQYLPAALLCVDMLVTGRRRRLAGSALIATVTLQALCSVYMVYTTALVVGLYALAVLIAEPRAERLRASAWLAGCLLVAALLVAAGYGPYLEHAREEWQSGAAAPTIPSLSRWWATPAETAIARMLGGSLGAGHARSRAARLSRVEEPAAPSGRDARRRRAGARSRAHASRGKSVARWDALVMARAPGPGLRPAAASVRADHPRGCGPRVPHGARLGLARCTPRGTRRHRPRRRPRSRDARGCGTGSEVLAHAPAPPPHGDGAARARGVSLAGISR